MEAVLDAIESIILSHDVHLKTGEFFIKMQVTNNLIKRFLVVLWKQDILKDYKVKVVVRFIFYVIVEVLRSVVAKVDY